MTKDIPQPTPEMKEFYGQRTRAHIERVRKYLKELHEKTELGDILLVRGSIHDASKFEEPERTPYIWLTWYFKCKREGTEFAYPPGVEEAVKEAAKHHVETNTHHPEAHKTPEHMTDVDIAEMVADWTAMAEEFGEGSPRGWAEKNVGSKWTFGDGQVELIYSLIGKLET